MTSIPLDRWIEREREASGNIQGIKGENTYLANLQMPYTATSEHEQVSHWLCHGVSLGRKVANFYHLQRQQLH